MHTTRFWNNLHHVRSKISPHTREMEGRSFSFITLWEPFHRTKRRKAAHFRRSCKIQIPIIYTTKVQSKVACTLMQQIENVAIYEG